MGARPAERDHRHRPRSVMGREVTMHNHRSPKVLSQTHVLDMSVLERVQVVKPCERYLTEVASFPSLSSVSSQGRATTLEAIPCTDRKLCHSSPVYPQIYSSFLSKLGMVKGGC